MPGGPPPSGRGAAWRPRRRRVIELWAAGLVASLLVTGASALGWLEPVQARTLDLVQWLGGRRFPPEIVIVAVDEAAFEGLGARQPLPRGYLARVIRGLARSGAGAVGLDITLNVPTTPAEDGALARALLDFAADGVSRVVILDGPPPDRGPLADSALGRSVLRGSDRVPIDADGVVRRMAVLVPGAEGRSVPTLGAAVLSRLRGAVMEPLRLPLWRDRVGWQAPDDSGIPLRAGELSRINFVGPQGSFLTIPSDTLAALGDGEGAAGGSRTPVADDNPLRGRLVLVGATFAAGRDFVRTPVGLLPGVEVHANVAHMLAARTFIRSSGWLAGLGIQLVVVLVAGVVLAVLRPLAGTLLVLLVTLAVGVPASYLAFHGGGYAVDFVLPVLVTCALGVGAEVLARRRLVDSFGRYVGREVMKEVLAERGSLTGDRRDVSVLVSDLRGFTTLSESLPVEQVAAHLNEYFPVMIDAIFAHRGMVNDFIGDGILAIFGAPLPDSDHAWRAASAAVAMQVALTRLNQDWETRGLPTLRMGIGIHSGTVFAGNVGGTARVKYTVVGDTVNATARLEGLNKDFGTTMLVTEETRTRLGDRAETRYCGETPVKGRAQPLRVYELLGVHAGQAEADPGTGGRA